MTPGFGSLLGFAEVIALIPLVLWLLKRTPVGGARLTIETHDFTGTQVIASSFADAEGAFELPPTRPGSHGTTEAPAPVPDLGSGR